MMKTLRYFFVAALAMVVGNAMAQDIWTEDWSSYTDFTVLPTNTNYSFAGSAFNDDGTVKSGTKLYNGKLAGGEAPELLVAKTSGAFTATVDLAGKSGDMYLAFKCNKTLTIEVTGGTLGDNAGSGNDYLYPITGASGTLTIAFKNTQSANARLDNIRLYQGQGKKPAGLSWGTSGRTVTMGAEDNTFPALQNTNNLAVTYKSSETGVATIATDGTITLVAAGTTVITAESAETDEFEAGKAEYTLTVKEAAAPAQKVTVAEAIAIVNALEDGKTTDAEYEVSGFVVGTPDFQRNNSGALYGNVNFDMADTKNGTEKLTVYRAKSFSNQSFTEETISVLKDGDEVVVKGKLQKYVKNGVTTPEVTNGYLISVNGQTTGIAAVKADTQFEGKMYNLAGQVVNKGYKGLVIVNGKKVVLK